MKAAPLKQIIYIYTHSCLGKKVLLSTHHPLSTKLLFSHLNYFSDFLINLVNAHLYISEKYIQVRILLTVENYVKDYLD